MKKVVMLLAVLGFGLSLVGCGGDAAPPAKKETPKAETPKKEEPKSH